MQKAAETRKVSKDTLQICFSIPNSLELTENVGIFSADAGGLQHGHPEGKLLAYLQMLARFLGILVALGGRVRVNATSRVGVFQF